MLVGNLKFKVSEMYQYNVLEEVVYRFNYKGDKFAESHFKINRKVGIWKIHADHFQCALPYTVYYLIDTITGKIYESEECHSSQMNTIVRNLREHKIKV